MKKQYQKPQARTIEIDSLSIICGSPDSNNIGTGGRRDTGNNDYIGFGGPAEGEID